MKRAHLLAHLLVPALIALLALLMSLRYEPFSGELLVPHLVWGYLFYAVPHLLWAGLSAALRPSLVVWHSGFVTSSASLVFVGAMSVWGAGDPSGLPYQWLVYLPLCGFLAMAVLGAWFLAGRPRAST
ncbi:hypothetical protein [Hydrogenophaga sp. 5NK40-0174]|uniref:hypothetical protein n=1 Tax=Hydrogenophaga sp. 5NK40-0174 TaxID=3127649 RepID=UPI0031029839